MRILFFIGGVVLIGVDYFVRNGLITALGLSAILTAVSSHASKDSWQTKYRPG